MQGCFLRFYVHENHRYHGRLLWEWLLEQANRIGIRGGSAFRAMAGFGRHHVVHESHFFELAGTLTVEVEFIVTDAESKQLLEIIEKAQVRLQRVLGETDWRLLLGFSKRLADAAAEAEALPLANGVPPRALPKMPAAAPAQISCYSNAGYSLAKTSTR